MVRRGLVLVGVLSALALTSCASVDWEERYNDLHGDLLEVMAERDAKQQELVEAYTREESLKQAMSARERELADSRRQLNEATQRAQEYASTNAGLNRDLDDLRRQAEVVAQPPVETTPTAAPRLDVVADDIARQTGLAPDQVHVTPDGNIEITLPSDVTFGSGEAKLTNNGRKSLRAVAPTLKGEFGAYHIRIEGHTDNEPLKRTKAKWGDNFGLASARALEVVRFLERDTGIEPTRLMSASRGQHEPVASNANKSGRSKNRRVEIVVVIPQDAALSMAK